MDRAKVIQVTKNYILCPWCQQTQFEIFPYSGVDVEWGAWFCKDCGGQFRGETTADGVFVEGLHEVRKGEIAVFFEYKDMLIISRQPHYFGSRLAHDIHNSISSEIHFGRTYTENILNTAHCVVNLISSEIETNRMLKFKGLIPFENKIFDRVKNYEDLKRICNPELTKLGYPELKDI